MEKFWRVGQATDDNISRRMPFSSWIPNATNTHSECHTYCFSTATMVMRRCLSVTLYIHGMSCSSTKIIWVEYPNLARTFIEKIRMHGQTGLKSLFTSDLCYCYCNINVFMKTRIKFCVSIPARDYSTADSVKSNRLNTFHWKINCSYFYITLVKAELFHADRQTLIFT